MQKIINALIEMQEIDFKLSHLEEERGDLPQVVEKLKATMDEKQGLLKSQKDQIKKLEVLEKNIELELSSLQEKMKQNEAKLYEVKTNKEYDAISHETEALKNTIEEIENKVISHAEEIESLTKSNEQLEKELAEMEEEFKESDAELQEMLGATSEEENLLRQEREIVKSALTPRMIDSYQRIRQAKNGIAVAYSNGGVCSGCFSFIPPQKVAEVKQMKNLYYCESCGRILVWDRNEE